MLTKEEVLELIDFVATAVHCQVHTLSLSFIMYRCTVQYRLSFSTLTI